MIYSRKKTPPPSAFGTSPKFHELAIWGGWVGAERDGAEVVRFGNEEVMKNLSVVLGKIRKLVASYAITNKE